MIELAVKRGHMFRQDMHAGGKVSVLLLAGLLLYALNLRGPVVAVAPVVEQVRGDLGIGIATAGLLTSLPLLCFSLTTPLASLLLGRVGPERAVLWSAAGILIGTIFRSSDGVAGAFGGTLLIGAAMTVGNVVVPVVIGRDFRRNASMVTGLYGSALNLGSMLTTALTAAVAVWTGWRWALILWSAPVVIAAILWRAATRRKMTEAARPNLPGRQSRRAARRPVAWGLTIAFACHTFSYYGFTAWLPKILADVQGMGLSAAGLASSIFQVMGLVGSFGVPVVVAWFAPSPRVQIIGTCLMWTALPFGLLFAPSLWLWWSAIAGTAQGCAFTVIFTLIVANSETQDESRSLSSMVQGGGYALAAIGPYVVGSTFAASGGWTWPLCLILGMIAAMAAAGVASAGNPPAGTR
jgi:CP family cyanate transporter-like MFS transporter